MIGVVVGVGDVGDVVHEPGDGQLGIVGMLGAEERAALEGVGETVELGLVAHAGSAGEQRDEIGDGADRMHSHIFAAASRSPEPARRWRDRYARDG